jgi:methanethiol S-methyltransferase
LTGVIVQVVCFNPRLQQECYLPDYITFILRLLVFAVLHSVFATPAVKQLPLFSSGITNRIYRVVYNISSFFLFAWTMSSYRHSPLIYFIPGVWSLAMYCCQFFLLLALARCVQQTDAGIFLGIRQLRDTGTVETLKTEGFYAVVRHPLYLISILFMLLNPVMSIQWLILTLFSTIYFIAGAIVEEKRLIESHGEEYISYMKKVPFIIPAWRVNSVSKPSE